MNAPGRLHRRSRAAMRALLEQMRELEQQGVERQHIARQLNCTPAQVTNGLGPVKAWRARRTKQLP